MLSGAVVLKPKQAASWTGQLANLATSAAPERVIDPESDGAGREQRGFRALGERNVLQVEAGSTACDTFPRAAVKTAGLINSRALEAVIWQRCNPCRQP